MEDPCDDSFIWPYISHNEPEDEGMKSGFFQPIGRPNHSHLNPRTNKYQSNKKPLDRYDQKRIQIAIKKKKNRKANKAARVARKK
jgi:hypothetical protein